MEKFSVGNTPLVELKNIESKLALKSKIFAKLESFNPSGSVKDRIALGMIVDAENENKLSKGSTIIEPTSGNTGIGLANFGVKKGYRVILTMPESMSQERREMLKKYGAELVLTPAAEGMKGAIKKAQELNKEIPNSIILDQFNNPSNPKTHFLTTGPEIFEQLPEVDYLVSGVGTGGTISGAAKYLKSKKNIKAVAVEPLSSAVLSTGVPGKHKIQGIGAGFKPNTLDLSVVDEIVPVSDDDAFTYGRMINEVEKISAGISSGAALAAAIKLAKRESGKNIVVIFPDGIDRYYSTALVKHE